MSWKWLTYAAILNFHPVVYVFSQDVSKDESSEIPCDEGWFNFGEKCYRHYGINDKKNWSEAADHCTNNGGHLASIHSKEELDFLVSFLLLDVKWTSWIGLNNRLDKSVYSWHDGSPLNYSNWMPNEPNGAEEDCAEMVFTVYGHEDHKIGRWNDVRCDNRRPYICEKKTDPDKQTADPQFCSSKEGGGWKYQTSCYHVVTEQKTWDEAEDYCNKNFSGHLVTVLDTTVDFFLNHIVSSSNEKVWIGIKIGDQFQQKWTSGWHVSYDAGLSKRQGDFKEGLCVLRNNRKEWTITPCSEAHSFVCESSKVISPVLKPAANGSYCPTNFPDWRDIGGESCYFVETEKRVKWDQARQECESRGGNLASIHSKEENEILHPFVKYTQGDVYIGLVRTTEDRKTFRWVDGSQIDYTNWDKSQPDDYQGIEACGEAWRVWAPTMQWNDVNCNSEKGYICSIKKVNFCISKCGRNPGVECAGDMYDEAAVVCKCSKDGHSYDEERKECTVDFCTSKCGRNSGVECAVGKYDEAAAVCKCSKDGHSYDEERKECRVNFCISKCGRNPGVECIGDMYDEAAVVCKCSKDDHSYDKEKKECKGLLKDEPRVKSSDDVIPCDEGWYYFREKCYRVYGKNSGKIWPEAASHCTDIGGHLVTIHNKEELDFLVAFLLLDAKTLLWIGLNSQTNKSEFIWHDGTRLTWTNWSENEPNGAEEHCVEMVFTSIGFETKKIGEWNDNVCANRHPYICQRSTSPEKKTPDPRFCSSDNGGGWKFGDSCYHVVMERKTWDEAEEHCNKDFNGHLVTVLDMTVDFFLNHLVNKDTWIGIKSRNQFQQKWSSGWHVGYDAGLTKRHGTFEKGFCVLRINRNAWSLAPCSERNSFVCEKSEAVSPVLVPAVEGSHCPTNFNDWRDLGGDKCYFIDAETQISWYRAEFECKRRGANLVSIHSKEENDILHPFIRYTQNDILIGLQRSAENRKVFEWSDGTPLDFHKWDPAQPDDRAGVESCAEFWKVPTSNFWNDVDCEYKKGYICSVKKILPDIPEGNDSPINIAGSQLPTEAVIGIAASVVVVLVLIGVSIYFLRPWCMRRIPTNIFSKSSNIAELTVEDDYYHVYEPIEYFQRFQRSSENAQRLTELPTTGNGMPQTQHKIKEEEPAHTYESMI